MANVESRFFACPRAPFIRAPTLAQTIGEKLARLSARALAHALRACDWLETKRQSIHWSRAFWEI